MVRGESQLAALLVGQVRGFPSQEFGSVVVDHSCPRTTVDHLVRLIRIGNGQWFPRPNGQVSKLDGTSLSLSLQICASPGLLVSELRFGGSPLAGGVL